MSFYVYIVASARNGTIYIGSTDDLAVRVWQHKSKERPGFTRTYGCDKLVWYNSTTNGRPPSAANGASRSGG
jgi:putative endonuclease